MRDPLESHGYLLDWNAIYTSMWDLAEDLGDGVTRVYRSEGRQALKWLIADLTGTPVSSGQTMAANNGLRKQVHRAIDQSGTMSRNGQRTFYLSEAPQRIEPNEGSRHILATWNPGPSNDEQYTPEEWEDFVARVAARPVHGRWSVGQRQRDIEPGAHVYMLRQGQHGRGLVASGVVTSRPYEDDGFREGQASARYVAIEWRRAVPLEARLDVAHLQAAVPGFKWSSVYGSGREVRRPHAALLHAAWLAHLGDSPHGRGGGSDQPLVVVVDDKGRPVGAGFGSAEQNAKVEAAAMRCVIDVYGADGWRHHDVSREKVGWDVTFTRGGEEHHVEVKGVAGAKIECFVTANELEKARTMPSWRLAIVTDALSGAPQYFDVDHETVVRCSRPTIFKVKVPLSDFN
jgi:hypothetical protein